MFRIGKLTDYAFLILGQMALNPNQFVSANILAELLKLNFPTVSKVLKILSDAQLVYSSRGVEGGYKLAQPAEMITVAHVIKAMEGGLALTECCTSDKCRLDASCTMRVNWNKINTMLEKMLNNYTIIDMLTPLT